MIPHRMVLPALSLLLVTAGFSIASASSLAQDAPRLTAYAQDRERWDAPPQDLQEIQRQGFRDGIEGARKDFDNHRRPDVNNREEFRDPQVRGEQREAYRDGFRRGYERGASHMVGGPQEPVGQTEQQMPMPPQQMRAQDQQMRAQDQQMRGPDQQMRDQDRNDSPMGPGMGSDVQRRGFQDGVEGARKDRDNHRRPNVNNRDEYRHPSISRSFRNEYREAYRRGYDRGMSRMMGGPMDDRDRR